MFFYSVFSYFNSKRNDSLGATEKLFKAIMNTNTETIPGCLIVYALEYTMYGFKTSDRLRVCGHCH